MFNFICLSLQLNIYTSFPEFLHTSQVPEHSEIAYS